MAEEEAPSNGDAAGATDSPFPPPLLFKLILAQLVNEKGEDAFPEIVKELQVHPLLQNIDERNMSAEVSTVFLFFVLVLGVLGVLCFFCY